AKIVAMNKAIADMRRTFEVKLFDTKLQAIPETLRADVKAALAAEEGKRSEVQKYLVEKLGASLAVSADEVTNALDEEAKKMVADSTAQIAELEKQKQALGSRRIEALEDVCWALLNTNEFLFQH
ncbi:MAG TPA: hypothetical protein P5307_28055, partial [Pirellulaceae bacterium]|nr:hypothetical protein [Pirellulaceae bacterium]